MTVEHVLRVAGDMAGFEQGAAAVRSLLDECHITDLARYRVEAVFEEVVTNVVRHGFADRKPHHIDVSLTCKPDSIVMVIEDDGRPFNPLERADPVRPASLDTAPLGGLGVMLVRKMSTALRYERTENDRNRLTVTMPVP